MLAWVQRRPGDAPDRRTVAIAAVAFALALLSKESAIMLPALILLVDAARAELTPGALRTWLHRNGRAFALLAVIAVGYLALRTAVLGDLGPSRLDPVLEVGTPLQQRLTALQIWPVVLRVLLFPVVLLADYSARIIMPALPVNTAALLGGVLLFGMLASGLLAFRRGNGRFSLALLWLPLTLLPTSSLIIPIGVLVAERALYLPSAALAFAVAFALDALAAVSNRRIAYATVLALSGAFAVRSLVRIPEWRSTDTIFAALIRDRPDSFRAHWHTARIALRDRQPQLALARYGRALDLWPYRRQLVLEAATQASLHGDRDYARRLSSYMLQRWPGDLDASRMFAGAALDRGDTTAARATIDQALRLHPGDTLLLRMRAAIVKDST
jgi:tetratricopeptide (TPR) repeat protein